MPTGSPRVTATAGALPPAALPRLLGDVDPAEPKWLMIGFVAATIVMVAAWFVARTSPSETVAALGDSAALGALAIGYPSPALVALFVLVVISYGKRTASLLALAAPVGAYVIAMLVRAGAGLIPAGERASTATAALLLVVTSFAVLAVVQANAGPAPEQPHANEAHAAS